ncbi:GNAT family N-acetyltransferase [Chryseobacterium foetidum]|uniref:GNAT family N-acetyltransferase n=1 Tax=Chryseobacterium foetidum TaxID=2951057 RepID=UPI0021C6DD49|nr:GNAT family N-acetyltransferase [Chryseobacterium foetidum]
MEIIKANTYDHKILTEITKKSKAYWGYSNEQMEEWSDLLTIKEEYFKNNEVYKLLINNSTVAYYSYFSINENTVKLDNLFVLPDEIGKGYGKLLMNDFISKIKKSKTKIIILDADPNAQKFYESFGFTKIGKIETSIKNRFLPIMELQLDTIVDK